jgi:hypothetical protein
MPRLPHDSSARSSTRVSRERSTSCRIAQRQDRLAQRVTRWWSWNRSATCTTRAEVEDDFWGGVTTRIVLSERFEAEAPDGIKVFSHAEIVFLFDRVDPSRLCSPSGRTRSSATTGRSGVAAQVSLSSLLLF